MICSHQHFYNPSFFASMAVPRRVFDKMPATRPYKTFLERRLGKLPQLLIYAVLEWVMIILLLADGLLNFVSNGFAKCFELKVPCLLCTRIDHLLVRKNSCFYYNDSICEAHKKGISSLAYCQAHGNLSDIRSMCQSCLLSTEKDADSGRYKSLVGILHKGAECFVENNDKKLVLRPEKKDAKEVSDENGEISDCSCCGETLKSKSSIRIVKNLSMNHAPALVPSPSPRASFLACRNEEGRNIESPRFRYPEARQILDNKSDVMEDDASNVSNQSKEDVKASMASLCQDHKDTNEDANRTPRFTRGSKLLGIPLNSAPASPRLVNRGSVSRKLSVDRGEFIMEPMDPSSLTEAENDILNRLRKQVRLDHNCLMDLYRELDEERNASNVAANNAMAMITRLQAEKAAVQMEALQYQRMMEEQTEYDEEAFQVMQDMLEKRDEDVKALESELQMYREKYGFILKEDGEFCEVDEDYPERKSQSLPSFGENSDSGSLNGDDQIESDRAYDCYMENKRDTGDKLSLDFEGERSYLLCLLTDLEKKLYADGGWNPPQLDMITHEDDDGSGNNIKATLTREVSSIKERLRAVEADSGFLKHAALTLQNGTEGTKLLNEIAGHLRNIRKSMKSPSDNIEA